MHSRTIARPRSSLSAPAAPLKQPASDQANVAASAAVLTAIRAPARELADRDHWEARFGHDFSRVRVHSDAQASLSAAAIDADAYAVGRHVVFAQGRYEPHTERGRRLLAHELAHVVQHGPDLEPAGHLDIAPAGHPREIEADRASRGAVAEIAAQPRANLVQRQPNRPEPSAGTPTPVPDTSRWPFGNLTPADIRAAYIDDRAVSVAVKLMLGAAYITLEDGREIVLPLAEFREASYNFVPILPGAPTRELAQSQAAMLASDLAQRGLQPVSFYRDGSGVFIPTVLNYQTLPRIWPTFEQALEADRAGLRATEEGFRALLWWYVGARFPARAREPAEPPIKAPGEPAAKRPGEPGGQPAGQAGTRQRVFNKPTVTPDASLPAGEGFTNKFGDITYSTQGSATDVALTRNHELVHSILSPKLRFLRNFRADLAMAAYEKSAFLKYLEEALAETYAQVRVRGLRGLPTGISFPITNGYVTVRAVVTEAAIGTVVVGGVTYGVYVVADRPPSPARAPASKAQPAPAPGP